MTKVVSALTARTQFGQIMSRAKKENTRFIVDKRGEPQVVIMSIKDYLETFAPEPEILAKIRTQAKRKGKEKLSMRDIGREIAAYRREKRQAKNSLCPHNISR